MKKQKLNKKISLNKETIAKLGAEEMGKLNGGDLNITKTLIMHGCIIVPISNNACTTTTTTTIWDPRTILENPKNW